MKQFILMIAAFLVASTENMAILIPGTAIICAAAFYITLQYVRKESRQ